jgi:recombination protein RecR
MIFSSRLIEQAVQAFSKLPGIGKKSALRMVLHVMKMKKEEVADFLQAIQQVRNDTKICKQCFNISDHDVCTICNNSVRKKTQLCIVESIRDVIAIESTQQYNGLYHVLGGVLSPLDGIGPEQLHISNLQERIQTEGTEEIIMALSPTIEGDTTVYYLSKMLQGISVKITTIARGIAFGGELEYADEVTLARSISKRLPIDNYVSIQNES